MRLRIEIAAFVLITAYSCVKKGCTDSKADNFSETSTADNGTCKYSAQLTLFWLKDFSDDMKKDSIQQFQLFVNGKLLNTFPSSLYWNQKPDAASSSLILYSTDFVPGTEKTVFITLFDESGWLFKKAYYTFRYPGSDHYKQLESKLE